MKLNFQEKVGHIDRDEVIPLRVEQIESKITPDPVYPLAHAIDVARILEEHDGGFIDMINRFFDLRDDEVGRKMPHGRGLVFARRIGAVNECIAETSAILGKIGKPFPPRDKVHIDVGCGMGFGMAASSKSSFGQNVIGIDLAPHYLVMAKRLLAEQGVEGARLVCGDVCDGWPIELDDHNVGFISMEGVLEHIKRLPEFFANVRKLRSFPSAIYLTVPYRWTFQPEPHFNVRGVGLMPRSLQDRYVAWRLGEKEIDHVEQYSVNSLRRMLASHVEDRTHITLNSTELLKAHYLKCVIYIESAADFR
ncbi:class I SAM-dependent methyltransferase [Bradyrhizobium septentrionale]|uniref:Class I SAM-dependent methyltransferase n=1 Tax=Bradyrhizobium septentrionale TaxID=1404411 RepID=A0A973VWZ6_9BRAD|nr:class I SAM-dependent methyltransferase [Bradyrhizobium septentrionale]UGY20184.1 class I SAM-dependent methyltransferase [Bradyrhizobium septentrionale]